MNLDDTSSLIEIDTEADFDAARLLEEINKLSGNNAA